MSIYTIWVMIKAGLWTVFYLLAAYDKFKKGDEK